MAKFIGRTTVIGIATEVTRGTGVAADYSIPVENIDFDDKVEYIDNVSGLGRIEEINDSAIIKKWSEGSYDGKVFVNSLGVELVSLFGSADASPTTVASGVYQHDYTVTNTNTHSSASLSYEDALQDHRFARCMLNGWSLQVVTDDYIKRTASWMGMPSENVTHSPVAYSATEAEFIPKNVTLKMASALAGLGAASAINVTAINIDFAKNVEALYVVGSDEPEDILNKQFSVSGSIEMFFEAETYRDYVFAGTKRAMRVTIENDAIDLGSGNHPTLELDFASVSFKDFVRGYDSNEFVTATISFNANYSLTDSAMVTAKLINGVSTYVVS